MMKDYFYSNYGSNIESYVFPSLNKGPSAFIGHQTPTRWVQQMASYCDLPNITFHGFRHSAVVYWIHLGIDSWRIAQRIGDTVEMVNRVYGDIMDENQKKTVEIINEHSSDFDTVFEKYLKGKNGKRQIDMDVNGNITGEYITEEPIVGSDVELTIDANIQAVAEKALKDDIEKIENGKADWLHYDVMDGHFVPNISFGYSILKDVSKVTNLFLDVHLMISEPQKYVDEFIKSGANLIVFHIETMENKEDTLALIHHIKENNVQVGISIKPNTPVDAIQDYLSLLDVVLVMSVEPGFGGQSFKEIALDKIKDLASRRKDNNYNYLIEVDGGINESTGNQCKEAGVDVLVAGSYVFNSEDCSQRIASLK